MKIAVQFGAGNIGRGFMGQLFWEAGYKIIFIEANESMVELLNTHRSYPLKILDAYTKKEVDLDIDNFEGFGINDTESVADAISKADVMSTAVGVSNLSCVAHILARGLEMRYMKGGRPVDIYLCENVLDAADILKSEVLKEINKQAASWMVEKVGFVGTVVGRMVPSSSDRFGVEHPLFVVADSYHHLPYDGMAMKSEPLEIKGMKAVPNFRAEVERKLFTHNLGHAVLGYMGYLNGYSYVHEPFEDEHISSIFDGALNETSQALLRKFPNDLDIDEHDAILKDVHIRFGNPLIQDTVQRVARDPIRKLGPKDRLIGSADLCLSNGVFPKQIAYICGAALCYDYREDEKAVQLQQMIRRKGVESVLEEISHVDIRSEFAKDIIDAYYELAKSANEKCGKNNI